MTIKTQKPMRTVALAYPVAMPWMVRFVQGMAGYADKYANWKIITSPSSSSRADEFCLNIQGLRGWPCDGIVAAIQDNEEAKIARELDKPVVNLAAAIENAGIPRVMVDHFAIGHMAADYLIDRGFRRLVYCGIEGVYFSQQRGAGFLQQAKRVGASCEILELQRLLNPYTPWEQRIRPLSQWLLSLEKPVGLMAVHDQRARIIAEECQRLKLDVPNDVAIIGVDNDTIACEYSQPTLSSVCRNSWLVGYETAALLDKLMSGESPSKTEILIPPEGIVTRQSTDTVAVDDRHLAAAVHYMHNHLSEDFGIDKVVKQVSISRRQLEMRFRKYLGCSPKDYLLRLRIERAKELLENPIKIKVHKVAMACGFPTDERFRVIFRRLTGQSPTEYRNSRQSRLQKS